MSKETEQSPRKRRLLRSGLVLAFAAALFLAGAGFTKAVSGSGPSIFHHQGVHREMMRAGIQAHVSLTLKQLDATPEQKTQIEGILNRFFADHEALEAEHKALHDRALAILTAPTIDRRALETLRQDGLQKVDIATSQIATVMADVAEVLTPAQREQLKLLVEEHFK